MEPYEENYLKKVEDKVDEIRRKAQEIARTVNPNVAFAVDKRTINDYCGKQWDYPGVWYTYFRYPDGFRNDQELIHSIVTDTLAYFSRHSSK